MRKLPAMAALAACVVAPAFATAIEATVDVGTTHCGWYLDGATIATVLPVTNPTTCRMVLSSTLAAGNHTVTADARMPASPPWSTVVTVSPLSLPFTFTKPAPTGGVAPTDIKVTP